MLRCYHTGTITTVKDWTILSQFYWERTNRVGCRKHTTANKSIIHLCYDGLHGLHKQLAIKSLHIHSETMSKCECVAVHWQSHCQTELLFHLLKNVFVINGFTVIFIRVHPNALQRIPWRMWLSLWTSIRKIDIKHIELCALWDLSRGPFDTYREAGFVFVMRNLAFYMNHTHASYTRYRAVLEK